MIRNYPDQPAGSHIKRCPTCNKLVYAFKEHTIETCPFCEVPYEIHIAQGDCKKAGNAHGFKLISLRKSKECSLCGENKALSEYNKDGDSRDRHASRCRDCSKKANKHDYKMKFHPTAEYVPLSRPTFSPNGSLNQVLPFLINISKRGIDKDRLLNESLETIKEALA